MAKVKVKMDVAAIKKWLLANGEKVALGVILLVFLMFVWGAIFGQVLPADKQPDQLQRQTSEVTTHLTGVPWDDAKVAHTKVSYEKRVARDKVPVKAFTLAHPLNPPLADPKNKRVTPELLTVEELKVTSGYGTFAMSKGAASKLKGTAWVAITGLVPYQKQLDEYGKAFDRSQGGDRARDVPVYSGFKIERAEINDSNAAEPEWKPVLPAPIVKEFAAGPAEVVKPEFVDPVLTRELRPLVPPDWGDAVTHPKIPLAATRNIENAAVQAVNEAPKDEEIGADGFQAGGKALVPKQDPDAPKEPEETDDPSYGYRLFRGFDFSVEPNKKYRYRVVLRLLNPNFALGLQYLDNPDVAKDEHLLTPPTEASHVVSIPDGYRVLAGGVKPPKMGEPFGKLMLLAIDKDSGMEASYELEVWRGAIANAIKDVLARDPLEPRNVEEKAGVAFKSDTVVIDMRGGKTLPGRGTTKLLAPGDLLLLDRNGDLAVRSELGDEKMYAARKPAEDEAKEKKDPIEKAPAPPPPRSRRPRTK